MDLPESSRVRPINGAPVRDDRGYVLYWMNAARRSSFNFALDRAIAWADELRRPLIVFEALRTDYRWASDRLHRFILDGMRANAAAFSSTPAHYYPYVEPKHGAGKGLLKALGSDACVVVTDDFPCFFLPQMVSAAGQQLDVRLESVDSNGLLPMRSARRAYPAAVHFRRYLQSHLAECLKTFPEAAPFAGRGLRSVAAPASAILHRWPRASPVLLEGSPEALAELPIDHEVFPVRLAGGSRAAAAALRRFVTTRLEHYHVSHNHPDDDGTSRLSPYLHFGHLSAHEIFNAVMRRERWSAAKTGRPTGAREGWWGTGAGAEAFLDQLLVWRELSYNTCALRPDDYDRYESLPPWARDTLEKHRTDSRAFTYSRQQFEHGDTHDQLWNAAQRQLREEGWMHNYLRMLWGKKILEWSATPRDALDTMIAVMDRWALDGRDPNSYAGYFWTLGRYDRPWPERAIYGRVRSMSSESTRKKVHVRQLLATHGGEPAPAKSERPRLRRQRRTPASGRRRTG